MAIHIRMPVPRLRRGALAAAAVLAVTLAGAASAAACGTTARASADRAPRTAPLIVGDSTLLLATPRLGRLGFHADAQGCRQFDAGLAILSARRHAGRLPRVAILALGANGEVERRQIARALKITGSTRVLGLVTPRNHAATAARMRRAARTHPKRVRVLDWARHSAGRSSWFAADGLHVSHAGARAFARFLHREARPLLRVDPILRSAPTRRRMEPRRRPTTTARTTRARAWSPSGPRFRTPRAPRR